MAGILLKIREMMGSFSPSERIAAEYILDHPEETVRSSIRSLAESSGASTAAVMRLCRTIGCGGYRDLVIGLAGDTASQSGTEPHRYPEIRPGEDTASIAEHIGRNAVRAIRDSLAVLDRAQAERAAEVLGKAEKIGLYGVGASAVAAMDAYQKFLRIGKHPVYCQDPHIQLLSAANLGPGNAAVAISWSGETRETIDAAAAAKKSGAALIAITRFGKSRLADLADIRLQLVSPESDIRCGAMSSRGVTLLMIDILYAMVISRDYDRICVLLDQTRRQVSNRKYRGTDPDVRQSGGRQDG